VGKEGGKFQKDHSLRPSARGQRDVPEEDPYLAEIHELKEKVQNAAMPQKVEEIAYKEIHRLERMNPISAEYTVPERISTTSPRCHGIRKLRTTLISVGLRPSSMKTIMTLKR